MVGWSDVPDHGVPRLRAEWRSVPDDPPLRVVSTISVPVGWTETERDVPR